MPVIHVGLTVSDVASSASFYLAALAPLGYRYISQCGPRIGFGVESSEADFFLTQEMPGRQAGGGHVAFAAGSKSAVHEFFAAALQAGGRTHGKPARRGGEEEYFNAVVLDFDGNRIEVVFHEGQDGYFGDGGGKVPLGVMALNELLDEEDGDDAEADIERSDCGPVHAKSRTVRSQTGNTSISRRSRQSTASSSTSRPLNTRSDARSTKTVSVVRPALPASTEISTSLVLDVLQQSMADGSIETASMLSGTRIGISARTLAGTLIGAAAGAAVTYAACKSEEDSARAESDFAAMIATRRSKSRHDESMNLPDSLSDTGNKSRSSRLAIEQIPMHFSTYVQSPPQSRAIDYLPAKISMHASMTPGQKPASGSVQNVAGSELRASLSSNESRRKTLALPKFRSEQSRSTLKISSEVCSKLKSRLMSRVESEGLVDDLPRQNLIKARDSSDFESRQRSETSRHSTVSKRRGHTNSSKSRGTKTSSKRFDTVTESESESSTLKPPPDDHLAFVDEECERDSVTPSDSISNVGSRRSKSSKHSKSKKSNPSCCDKDSDRSSRASSRRSSSHAVRSDDISDTGSTETIKPYRYRRRSCATLPIRGVTPCMINANSRAARSYYD